MSNTENISHWDDLRLMMPPTDNTLHWKYLTPKKMIQMLMLVHYYQHASDKHISETVLLSFTGSERYRRQNAYLRKSSMWTTAGAIFSTTSAMKLYRWRRLSGFPSWPEKPAEIFHCEHNSTAYRYLCCICGMLDWQCSEENVVINSLLLSTAAHVYINALLLNG